MADNPDDITRREFVSRTAKTAAGVAVTSAAFSDRILGANDRVVLASIGIRGQGNALKRGFAKLANVEHKTLCDIDANLAGERINDPKLKDVPTLKPGFAQDLRRVLDDQAIDAGVLA